MEAFCLLPASCYYFLAWLIFRRPWRWRRNIPPQRYVPEYRNVKSYILSGMLRIVTKQPDLWRGCWRNTILHTQVSNAQLCGTSVGKWSRVYLRSIPNLVTLWKPALRTAFSVIRLLHSKNRIKWIRVLTAFYTVAKLIRENIVKFIPCGTHKAQLVTVSLSVPYVSVCK
jgi:hypothetical protein